MTTQNNLLSHTVRRSTAPNLARAGLLALAAGLVAFVAWSAERPVPTRASGPYFLVKTYPNPAPEANDEFGNAVAWLRLMATCW
jgi:hypothetical protein